MPRRRERSCKMCGIAGLSGEIRQPIMETLSDVLLHRGPDDKGSFEAPDYQIQLFHQRLAILDITDAGHQPMQSPDSRLALIYNGEIYNFPELRQELEQLGYQFRSQSDTEVVLMAYDAWGQDFLCRLSGIFAFALFDKTRKSVLLARDQMGVKPLYYACSKNRLGFCSEIKGLVRLMPELREIDQQALRQYFSFIYCPGDATPLKAVRKLEPGTAMWVRNGKIEICWQYYRLPALDPSHRTMAAEEAIEGTNHLLRQAVRRQMISDVPLGAFLSGGVDSTGIVAFAREQASDIQCFTIRNSGGRDAGETDDLPFAKMAANYLDVPLDIIDVEADQIPQDIENMIWHLDEPISDPASLNTLYISQLARQNGIKVLLSGTGGDDLFSGYRRHHALSVSQHLSCLSPWLRELLVRMLALMPATGGISRRRDKLSQILSNSAQSGLPAYFLWGMKEDVDSLFLASAEAPVESVMQQFLSQANSEASALQQMLALEQRFFLADHNLNYSDKMGMAASVEVRVPFLDLDLVKFAAQIPDHFKVRGLQTKWALKQALQNDIPAPILKRPKTGFGAPIRRWMRNELKEFLSDMLSYDAVKRRGLFEPKFVQLLMAENDSGSRDAAYTLFSLLSVEIWCQKFLDR